MANDFSGSGSLPYSSISKSDTKRNYARVYRSISGKPGITSWNYNWNTFIPYSSSTGSDVGAQLWLNVKNALAISAGSSSSNKGIGSATVDASVSSGSTPTSSLASYYTSATAFTNEVRAYQRASTSKGNTIYHNSKASDTVYDAWTGGQTPSGIGTSLLSNFYSSVTRTKTSASANLGFGSFSGLSLSTSMGSTNPVRDSASGRASRINDYNGIVTFSEFSGSSQAANSHSRADIYSLKANVPIGSMSIYMTGTTYPSGSGLIGIAPYAQGLGFKRIYINILMTRLVGSPMLMQVDQAEL